MALRDIWFSDTTLRDGEQMPGASLVPEQKVRIAHELARTGVVSLDAGFPASSRGEIEAIQRIAREVRGIALSALCRTISGDIDCAREALADAAPELRSVSLFVGTSRAHREHKLRRDRPGILRLIRESIEYARQYFESVAFSPEDATRTEPDFLNEVYREAIDAGARFLGFPDTVGILTPDGVRDSLRRIFDGVPNISRAVVAVHFHNDLGLATANTLAAFQEGISVAQCTVNGIGERAGNTAFEEVVMAVALHGPALGLRCGIHTERLCELSRLVAELTGIPVAANKAVVGANVFATEAGIHQDGLLKNTETYLPFPPEQVGAAGVRLVLGRHSGRAAFSARFTEMGFDLETAELDRAVNLAKAAPKQAWGDPDALLRSSLAAVRAAVPAKVSTSAG